MAPGGVPDPGQPSAGVALKKYDFVPQAQRVPWYDEALSYWADRLGSVVVIFRRVLVELGCSPPDGFRWTLHCIRAGAASECNALDIAMSKIRRQGDWSAKSTVPEDDYIDAQCPASDAGRRFFGWLMASAM